MNGKFCKLAVSIGDEISCPACLGVWLGLSRRRRLLLPSPDEDMVMTVQGAAEIFEKSHRPDLYFVYNGEIEEDDGNTQCMRDSNSVRAGVEIGVMR